MLSLDFYRRVSRCGAQTFGFNQTSHTRAAGEARGPDLILDDFLYKQSPDAAECRRGGRRTIMTKRAYACHEGSKPRGRSRSEIYELAVRVGISRQAAWWRLRRSTGRPRGRRPTAEISLLVYRDGISRRLAWWRLRRGTGKPRGRKRVRPLPVVLPPPSSVDTRVAESHQSWAKNFGPKPPSKSWF